MSPAEPAVLRARQPVVAAAAVGVLALALHLRDPHHQGSWGFCPFKALTGWDCPGCGGLRAVNDLGNGHLGDALHSNLLFVGSIPVIAALWVAWLVRRTRGRGERMSPRVVQVLIAVYGVLAVVFTVWRNTRWGTAWHVA